MRDGFNLRRIAAVFACAASLAGAAVAVTPDVAAAGPASSSCGSRSIAVKAGGKQVRVAASLIKVEGGATCAEAVAVIRGVVLNKIPKGWSVGKSGGYKVPHGLTAHVLVKGKKKVEFALPGA
ncbi:MAG: hypothetical protein JWO14_3505 [Solirubrobacterales bacterium]|nr:hypothetical protein [Solirubrobacterales bacterium]